MSKIEAYDYAIIGAGAAGLHLAMAILEHAFFDKMKILLIEKDDKSINDKTYSYWEKGEGIWDQLTYQIWRKGEFIDERGKIDLSLGGYKYKSIRALDFYEHGKKLIHNSTNIFWKKENVLEVSEDEIPVIKSDTSTYRANHIFDSRISPNFFEDQNKYLKVLQHFKGWVIETDHPQFDAETFTMMDYRVTFENQTFFTYVLPISNTKALVEATFFTPQFETDAVYDRLLVEYIQDTLNIQDYQILENEKGFIPMSNFPFHKQHSKKITKIGTAGGWVKASSGYAFKNIEKSARKLVSNVMNGKSPHLGVGSWKFRKYDTLFLDILQKRNHLGSDLFKQLYRKAPAELIFKFLDEETSFREDLGIILSLPSLPFLRSLLNHI